MAGPSLSHILDPPRPTSGRDLYSTPPPSYAHRDTLALHQQQQQQQHRTAGGRLSPSPSTTGDITTPPVTLPPPQPTPASSTLHARSVPAPVAVELTPPVPAPAPAPGPGPGPGAASTPTSTTHGHQLDPGAASAGSPSSPGLTSATPTPTPGSQPPSNHRGNNLYACRDCGRSYSRPEHLVRHVQTHTLGRRFVCEICQKSFARKDLLRRHVANHDNDSPKKRRRTTTSPGAGRVSHACRSCAMARVKCDDTKPCKRCISRKLTCVSAETPSAAAMHLIHSANAHSSTSNANDGDKPVTARSRSSVTSQGSNSPGSFTHQPPRSLPAPHSVHDDPVPQRHNNQNQRHEEASSIVLPHPLQAKPPSHEPSQLPTPDSSVNKAGTSDYLPLTLELEPATSAMDPNRLPFSDFLRDVLYANSAEPSRAGPAQGLTVLDFCDYGDLELADVDFELLDHWNVDGNHGLAQGTWPAQATHGRDSSTDVAQVRQDLVKMWTNSSWSSDLRTQEQRNFPATVVGSDSTHGASDRVERVIPEKLEYSARDRVLAIVLNTCHRSPTSGRVAASFPSAEVMDILVHNFLLSLANQPSEWVHFPTFRLYAQSPEWITAAAAGGAALSPIPTLRKFAFILQDAARATLPAQFDDTTTAIRDVALVQALISLQEIGLWSGNRRKMELAQINLAVPVTLMRYRSKFQRSSYPAIVVEASDEGSELDAKWRRWIEREQWKRLVFHCFLREAQCSMTTLTNQTMSYAELTLPLPEPRELWLAKNATEWKAEYLQRHGTQSRIAPSVGDLVHDIHLLPGNSQQVDVQFSVSVYLHAAWALILEYRQLSAVHRSRSYTSAMGGSQNLLLSSRHQELVKELQNFRLIAQEWPDITSQEHLLLNLIMMNLHVSLDDVQLFAGKEGGDQARRIYPVLQQWATNSEARSAIWCAGQVLRYAKTFAPGCLRDFYAVAVHHAALVLWTYGVITKANCRHPPLPTQYQSDPVYLDGSETVSIQRFIGFGQGRPVIRGPIVRDTVAESSLEDPRACTNMVQEVLSFNFKHGVDSLPPMVENLCTLARQLGDASWTAGLGSP